MNIEITTAEALSLATAQLRNNLYEHGINVTLAAEPSTSTKITSANKVELIKFARQLAYDAMNGTIQPSNDRDGRPYFGLADAKAYVEKYFKFTY